MCSKGQTILTIRYHEHHMYLLNNAKDGNSEKVSDETLSQIYLNSVINTYVNELLNYTIIKSRKKNRNQQAVQCQPPCITILNYEQQKWYQKNPDQIASKYTQVQMTGPGLDQSRWWSEITRLSQYKDIIQSAANKKCCVQTYRAR